MAAEKGVCRKRKWSKTGSLSLLVPLNKAKADNIKVYMLARLSVRYVVTSYIHMVPAIFHRHEVSVADVHKKIHRMHLADERFHLVVDLLLVVEEIRPLFGVKRDERTRIATVHRICMLFIPTG